MDWRKVVIAAIAVLIVFDAAVNLTGAGTHKSAAESNYTIGQNVDVAITLVSTDARSLACAGAEEVNGRHCEYETTTQRWSKASEAGKPQAPGVLAPYKTTDDVMFLIPGLFADPALVQRLSIDPPTPGEHSRFLAHCKLHVEGKMEKFDVRWQTGGQWFPATNVWIGTVSGCTLSDP